MHICSYRQATQEADKMIQEVPSSFCQCQYTHVRLVPPRIVTFTSVFPFKVGTSTFPPSIACKFYKRKISMNASQVNYKSTNSFFTEMSKKIKIVREVPALKCCTEL